MAPADKSKGQDSHPAPAMAGGSSESRLGYRPIRLRLGKSSGGCVCCVFALFGPADIRKRVLPSFGIHIGGQRLCHLSGPLETQTPVLGHHPIDDSPECRRDIRADHGRRLRCSLSMGRESLANFHQGMADGRQEGNRACTPGCRYRLECRPSAERRPVPEKCNRPSQGACR